MLVDSIGTEIKFKNDDIKIDRENELNDIKNSLKSSDILILRG
ncbi:hypothetical protein [Methanobrevibacter arboriphilus]|nr:hypothetical protein [Methanobrevibacter arboriphilus]